MYAMGLEKHAGVSLPMHASAGSRKSGDDKSIDLAALLGKALLKLQSTQEDFSPRPVRPKMVQAQGSPNFVVLVASMSHTVHAE